MRRKEQTRVGETPMVGGDAPFLILTGKRDDAGETSRTQ